MQRPKAIMDAGALSLEHISHGVLTNSACDKVEKSVLEELIADPIEDRCPDDCNKTAPTGPFGEAMRRITNEESVSSPSFK